MASSQPEPTRHREYPTSVSRVPESTGRAAEPTSRPRRPAPEPANPLPVSHRFTGHPVRRAAQGDQRAWSAGVQQYSGLLWSVTREFRLTDALAADAVQT